MTMVINNILPLQITKFPALKRAKEKELGKRVDIYRNTNH